MAEIKLNAQTLGFIGAFCAAVAGVYSGVAWLDSTVATKNDIEEIQLSIDDLRLDASIAFIRLSLQTLDNKLDKTPDDMREMRILETQLSKFELKKVNTND